MDHSSGKWFDKVSRWQIILAAKALIFRNSTNCIFGPENTYLSIKIFFDTMFGQLMTSMSLEWSWMDFSELKKIAYVHPKILIKGCIFYSYIRSVNSIFEHWMLFFEGEKYYHYMQLRITHFCIKRKSIQFQELQDTTKSF